MEKKEKRNLFICNLGIEDKWNDHFFLSNYTAYRLRNVEEISILLCKKEDIIILRSQPDEEYLDNLKSVGFEIPEMIILNSESIEEKLSVLIKKYQYAIANILKNEKINIIPYVYENELDIFENVFEVQWINKNLFAKKHNNKIYINRLLEKHRINKPPSYVINSTKDAIEKFDLLKKKGFKSVVLKMPYAAAGKGTFLINDKSELCYFTRLCLKHSEKELIIEGFFEKAESYNYQLYITEKGKINIFFVTEQIVNNTEYEGSFFGKGLDQRINLESIKKNALKVGKMLYDEGIYGIVGIDGIKYKGKYFPAIDVNVRCTMSTYLSGIEKRLGKNHSFLSVLLDIASSSPLTYSQIQEELDLLDIKYTYRKGKGILIYVSGTLPNAVNNIENYYIGRMYSLIIAESYEECICYKEILYKTLNEKYKVRKM